ncbi:DUF1310 family protein, partial [Streptococcus iniae]|uniref:DUF1310 family protein n=1 Tax=Streptococcus iniae TaxID=1346 RepID=UPI00035F1A2D
RDWLIWYIKQHTEKEKMIAIAYSKEAKVLYNKKVKHENKKALANNIKDFKIITYEIDNESLDYNPMGGLMVTLIVNGDKDLTIDFNLIDNGDGTYHSAYFGISEKLGNKLGY